MAWDISGNCLAQWKMNDDAPTTVVVDSQLTYDGVLQNGNTEDCNVAGKINGALYSADGVNRRIYVSNTIPMKDLFTLVFWIKAPEQGETATIFRKASTYGWRLQTDVTAGVNRRLKIRIDTSGGANQTFGHTSFCDNQWHMFVWVINAGAIKWSFDGAALSSDTYAAGGGLDNDTPQFRFISNDAFEGTFDNIIVLDREITQAEIDGLYNSGSGTEDLASADVSLNAADMSCATSTGSPSLDGVRDVDAADLASASSIANQQHLYPQPYQETDSLPERLRLNRSHQQPVPRQGIARLIEKHLTGLADLPPGYHLRWVRLF